MIGAARDDAAAGTGEALAVRRAEMDSLEARFGALMKDLAANPAFPGQDRRMTALIAAYRADRKALIDLMFAVELDASERDRAARPAAAPGRRGRHSAAAAPRWVPRVVQGLAIPAGLSAALKASGDAVKPATTALGHRLVGHHALAWTAGAGAVIVTTAALGPVHTLEDRTPFSRPAPPSAAAPAEPVTLLPSSQLKLTSEPKSLAHVTLKPHAPAPVVVVTPLPAPVPAPVPAAVPVVTVSSPSEPRHTSSWSGSGSSSQPSTSYQPSQSFQPSQPGQSFQPGQSSGPGRWQAQGSHASPYSGEGNSSYRPGHGDNGQGGNYWTGGQQSAFGQGAGRQDGQQQQDREGNGRGQHGAR